MAFVALEESSSRHLLADAIESVELNQTAVTEVPIVTGWVPAESSTARNNARRTDPEDPDDTARILVQIVAPTFDSHAALSNTTLPLRAGQLIRATILRTKHYTSTSYEFRVHFACGSRLAFEASMSYRKDIIKVRHAGHDRGTIRRRAGKSSEMVYHFHDEQCEQVVDASLIMHGNDAPLDMSVALGIEHTHTLNSRRAKWNDKVGAYVLDFQGLCDTASCKNMQLCPVDGPQDLANTRFIFGRQSDHTFQIYFRQPFTCLQAFATALILFSGSS